MKTKPCPFCGESELQGLTHGHKEGCFFDLQERRGISEAEYTVAWNRRKTTSFALITEGLRDDQSAQFTRTAWDQWGGVNGIYNRVYQHGQELRLCSWDGMDYRYAPTLDDMLATDWFRINVSETTNENCV